MLRDIVPARALGAVPAYVSPDGPADRARPWRRSCPVTNSWRTVPGSSTTGC